MYLSAARVALIDVRVRVKQGLFEMLYLVRTVTPSSFVSMFHVAFLQYSTPNMLYYLKSLLIA